MFFCLKGENNEFCFFISWNIRYYFLFNWYNVLIFFGVFKVGFMVEKMIWNFFLVLISFFWFWWRKIMLFCVFVFVIFNIFWEILVSVYFVICFWKKGKYCFVLFVIFRNVWYGKRFFWIKKLCNFWVIGNGDFCWIFLYFFVNLF